MFTTEGSSEGNLSAIRYNFVHAKHSLVKKGREEESSSPLCTTLKDHSNYFLQNKVDLSFTRGLELLKDQLMEEPVADSLHGSEHVVRL